MFEIPDNRTFTLWMNRSLINGDRRQHSTYAGFSQSQVSRISYHNSLPPQVAKTKASYTGKLVTETSVTMFNPDLPP